MSTSKVWGLNNNQLKVLAMLSMLLDHIGVQLFPDCVVLRLLGRISFPIFAYMIAEGCFYTKNRAKYLGLIAALGVGCQLVYYFAMGSLYQSVLITFTLSILVIYAVDFFVKKKNFGSGCLMVITILGVAFAAVAAPILFKAQGFKIDYGVIGVVLPIAVYYMPSKWWKIVAAVVVLIVQGIMRGGMFWVALSAVPLLALYNGKRGKYNLKYLFYIFYPTHLVLIYLVGLWMAGKL
jgi:hypothetical protein